MNTSPQIDTSRIFNKYTDALLAIPAPGAGCHPALLGAANLGVLAGLTKSEIMADLRRAIPHGKRSVPDTELADAVDRAMADTEPIAGRPAGQRAYRKPPPPPPPFDGPAFRRKLITMSAGIDEVDLWELSPIRIDWEPKDDAQEFITLLYAPDDYLYVGEVKGSGVGTVQSILARFKRGAEIPPHIIPNPMTGEQGLTKDGKPSRRCDATVKTHRFALVEFDNMAREDQLAFWHSVIVKGVLPITALIDTGGKSIHAWVRVDLPDAEAWDKYVKVGLYDKHVGRMAIMGVDTSDKNPSRLSRLPGHHRTQTGRWQRLLYLDPKGGKQ